jgi:hypothetical protein
MSDTDKENEENEENEPKNNWAGFLSGIFNAIIICLICALLGTNFVFLTRIDLDKMFPSNINLRPYKETGRNYMKLPPYFYDQKSKSSCGASIDINNEKILNNKFILGLFDYGFPYTLLNDNENIGFGDKIFNWFGNIIEYSYVWQRTFIKKIFNFIDGICGLSENSNAIPFIIGLIILPILILLLSHSWWLVTIFSTFFNAKNWFQIILSAIGCLFAYTWAIALGLNFVQAFGLIFRFIMIPPLMNWSEWKKILHASDVSFIIMFIFSICIISSAFTTLETPISATILCVILFTYFNSIYQYYKQKSHA